MQPPPRKVKAFTTLKNLHNEQVLRLQAKHQRECELLEDIRIFAKQRSSIEKEYTQSIQKLVANFSQKKDQLEKNDTSNKCRNIFLVWKSLLENTDKMSKIRLSVLETLCTQVQETLKNLKNNKIQLMKRATDQINKLQEEQQQCIREMDKSKKNYFEEEHIAKDARDKAQAAEERLKRKNVKFYQSVNTLEKNRAKFSSKREEYEKRSKTARNEYLLGLTAANAHLDHYFTIDLPDLVKYLEGAVAERIKESFVSFCETEIQNSKDIQDIFNTVKCEAKQISPANHLQAFLDENDIMTDVIQYEFEPCENDSISKIVLDGCEDLQLNKEARKCALRIQKDRQSLKELNTVLQELQAPKQTSEKAKVHSESDEIPTDLEFQIEDLQAKIRQLEISKLKAEVKIDALKNAGVDVDQWLNNNLLLIPDSISRSSSDASIRSFNSSFNEDDDDDDNTNKKIKNRLKDSEDNPQIPTSPTITKCQAIYSYKANNPDELSFEIDEVLELLSGGQGDGWFLAKNDEGTTGYIPQNYIEQLQPEENFAINPIYVSAGILLPKGIGHCRALYDYEATCKEDISFSEGAIITIIRKEVGEIDDGWWEGEIDGNVGLFPSLVVEEIKDKSQLGSIPASSSCRPPSFIPGVPIPSVLKIKPTSQSNQKGSQQMDKGRDKSQITTNKNDDKATSLATIEEKHIDKQLARKASIPTDIDVLQAKKTQSDVPMARKASITEKPEKLPKPKVIHISGLPVKKPSLISPDSSNTKRMGFQVSNIKPSTTDKIQVEPREISNTQMVEWETLV